MAIPVSTVPAVYAYLVPAIQTQLNTDASGSRILLTLVDPGEGPDVPKEIVNIGEVRRTIDPDTFIGSGGQFWLDEKYDIEGVVSVWTGSFDTDGATTVQLDQVARAWQIYAYVETALRLDPSLGSLVNIAYPQNSNQAAAMLTGGQSVGLLVEITFQIHVENLN